MSSRTLACLDVGEKRIGVAIADLSVRIAIPYETVIVDGNELQAIADIVNDQDCSVLVIGYPRNQSGEATAQTEYVESFVENLRSSFDDMSLKIVFQDESLTSVLAEQRLKSQGASYTKADIDAQAATIILQDYIESNYA